MLSHPRFPPVRFCLICFSLAGGSIWDDLGGERSYDRKGSLCHGRSTLPVYYFHLFSKPESTENRKINKLKDSLGNF